MKKEQKFLNELEKGLKNINKKKRDEIISKYKNLIESQLAEKRRIVDIIKSFGKIDELIENELRLLKEDNLFIKIKYNFIRKWDDLITNKKDKRSKSKKNKNIQTIHCYFSKVKSFIYNKFKKRDTLKNNIKEVVSETKEEISEVVEAYTEKNIFESKKTRIKRIILQTLGLILIAILLFTWLWVNTVFVASLFTILDGIKFYGINIALLGISLINLWLVIIVNKLVFKKHISNKWSLITLLSFILLVSIGIALAYRQYTRIIFVNDVGEKYSMTRNYKTYYLPEEKNVHITFNSNYKTKYIINYDNKLVDKYGVEVKYYECYYDFYSVRSSNDLYISLKLDYRDRISVYIDDLKENKIYDEDELSRYTVVITVNEKDKDRIIID